MPVATETRVDNTLTTAREPKGPKRAGDPGSIGDQALMDAIKIIAAAWILLILLTFSLRRYNI
jgi:hypothetical protein